MEAVRPCLLGCQLVRRVIGGDRVDHPIDQRLAQGITIVRASQGRIDIALWTHGPDVTRAQRQVMRGGFGCDRQPLRLRGTNQVDRRSRAHMLKVETSAAGVAQGIERIGHGHRLRVRAVAQLLRLGVDEERQPGRSRRAEGTAKHHTVHRMTPVV